MITITDNTALSSNVSALSFLSKGNSMPLNMAVVANAMSMMSQKSVTLSK